MKGKSKYTPLRIRKKYEAGGYGNQSYGSNEAELAYLNQQTQESLNASTSLYNNSTQRIEDNYLQSIQQSSMDAAQSRQLSSQIQGGIKFGLQGKMENGMTYNDYGNNWITDKLGIKGVGDGEQWSPASQWDKWTGTPKDNTPTNFNDVNIYDDPSGSGAQYEIINDEMVPIDHSKVQPEGNIQGEDASYNAEHYSTDAQGAIIETATGQIVGEATDKVGTATVDAVYGEVFKNASGDLVEKSTGKIIEEAGTSVAEKGAEEVGKGIGKSVAKAPVKGGLWTTGFDLGMHYLSDDKDASTYTAGEVGTDVASLALDIVTFDWVGAGFQLYDIGSQWAESSKLKKEKKKAEDKRSNANWKNSIEHTENFADASEYKGSRALLKGKKSGFGYGELGGFKYNI
jgi:hypothetical protein